MMAVNVRAPRRMLVSIAVLTALGLPAAGISQDNVAEMRRAVDLFSGVLRDGLGLDQRQGIFSPRNGDVQGRYLAGQGITLNIVAPLRGADNRVDVSMRDLGQTLDELALQMGDMMERGVVARPDFDALRDALALSLRTDEVSLYYRDLMEQLARIDGLPALDRALSQAVLQLRQLQSAARSDQSQLSDLNDELQVLRELLQSQLEAAMQLRREISRQAAEAESVPDSQLLERWQSARQQIDQQVQGLQRQLNEKMQALRTHQATVQAERQVARQQQLSEFEQQLFTTVCNFAGGLRDLPAGEYLNLVLLGAGQSDDQSSVRHDQVYTLAQADLQACQRGEINGQQLRNNALSYQY